MYKDELIPDVYKYDRPLHDDWGFWPFTLIPRKWTFWGFSFPPRLWAGNAKERWSPIQNGYPLAPDAEVYIGQYKKVKLIDPVHPSGQWSIQSLYFDPIKRRLPCYFTFTTMFLGRRLHFNIGWKPDVTVNGWDPQEYPGGRRWGDWGVWFPDASLTWTK